MSGQNFPPYFDPCYWKRYMAQYDTILEEVYDTILEDVYDTILEDVYDTIWHNIRRSI